MAADTYNNGVTQVAFDPATKIATLTLAMEGRANKINRAFSEGLVDGLDHALALDGIAGLIIATGHKDFCVGADIDVLYKGRDTAEFYEGARALQGLFRRIETAGIPVVAALTGSALGGGMELALACHRRIALDDPRILVGLPEVSLGVIPGGGGSQRLPRMIGIQKAMELILQGKTIRAPKAVAAGLVDEVVADRDALRAAAEAWIAANPKAQQPWDDKRFKYPGFQPGSQEAQGVFMGAAAMIYGKTAGAMIAPGIALRALHEGTALTFDRALEVEARYFAYLATHDVTKDIIRTFWYHRTAAERHEGLPSTDAPGIDSVGILGAGMMGAGLAFVAADKGYTVVVKDIAEDALGRGRAHVEGQVAKRKKHLPDADRQAILDRITWTLEYDALAGVDLVIEAVVENDLVKGAVTKATEAVMNPAGVFATNTSAIPITHLAKASVRAEQFIGLHFFSPVEHMPLLEIVMGEATSDATLARSLAFCRRIGKLPIVVNDGYGFFTSRVFGAYLMEGVELVAEGHDPVLIEYAGRSAGMAVAPLKVFDEVSLALGGHAMEQREKHSPGGVEAMPGIDILRKMGELGRLGKAAGKGFYDYNGRERHIWPGLRELAERTPEQTGLEYLKDRLMYAQIAEVGRTLQDGVLRQHRDAEVGSIFGIGFAAHSGGPLAWMDSRGLQRVVDDLRALADAAGERYAPSQFLIDMAQRGERFFEAV